MKAPSTILTRDSQSLRPRRSAWEQKLVDSRSTFACPYAYESLLRSTRQVPSDTPIFPSSTVGVDRDNARKYHHAPQPRKHGSPALSLRPPAGEPPPRRQKPPLIYPYVAQPVRDWPSRDPIEEEGGLNLYAMVGNDAVDFWDVLGLCKDGECKIHRIWRNNHQLKICFTDRLAKERCFEIEMPDFMPDIEDFIDGLKPHQISGLKKKIAKKIAEGIVKDSILKSIIKGLPGGGQLNPSGIGLKLILSNISLTYEFDQHYKICKCSGGSWGGWSWSEKTERIKVVLSQTQDPKRPFKNDILLTNFNEVKGRVGGLFKNIDFGKLKGADAEARRQIASKHGCK
jgi:hypothetical protein